MRPSGTTLAMIEGRSGRAVIGNTIRDLAQLPAFLSALFRRRDGQSWVFGNIHGFRDSPRYLSEHIQHTRPDIKAHWIAHSEEEADAARAAGLDVALRGQRAAAVLQQHAGVAVFTHGFRDLDLQHVAGSYLVFLWHGTPLKRIALDVGVGRAGRRSFAVRLASRVVRWIHRRSFGLVAMFVASGKLEHKRFVTAFGTSAERVPILGSPRFDVIRGGPEYGRIVNGDLRAQLGYKPEDRIVLWLPTHRRESGDASWLPRLDAGEVDLALGGTNIALLVKPHPRASWDVYEERLPISHPRVRLMPVTDADVNCLLHIADALVSDYSSVVCDYAILDRPLYFLAPDVEQYVDKRGLYDPYETLTGAKHHRDWPSLLDAIRLDFEQAGGGEGHFLARRMADYLGLNNDPDCCRRIVEAVIDSLPARRRAGSPSAEHA